jgi:Asp-tRNA(Asn)/Glu-tRNA(Gln) amidotransferase A subunit family amidase
MDEPGGLGVNHGLSRSVRDSATLLDVTCGAQPGDRWWTPPPERPFAEMVTREPRQLRIGLATVDFAGHAAHADNTTAAVSAAKLCESLGHRVEEVTLDIDGEAFNRAFAVIWSSIAGLAVSLVLRELSARVPVVPQVQRLLGKRVVSGLTLKLLELLGEPAIEPFTRRLAAIEAEYTPSDLWLAWNDLQQANYRLAAFFERYDLLLTPVLGQPPWKLGELRQDDKLEDLWEKLFSYVGYTPICNTAGLPAMSVPLYCNDDGLPIGVQFAAPLAAEGLLFSVAGQLERALPWANRRPEATP